MNNSNAGLLIAFSALVAIAGVCCIAGGAGFVMYRTRATSAPPAVYAPAPLPPPSIAPPSGPAIPAALPPGGTALVETADTPVRGPVGARLTIHVVSDFQCPFCSRVEPTLQRIDMTYPGQIRWVWHDYPLPFHQDAMPAAEAAREVRRQLGDAAFWTYHDQLFLAQHALDGRNLEAMASTLPGLDIARFRTALITHEHEATVRASIAAVDAAHSGTGTPCFLVGDTWVVGAQPFERFQTEIDRQLR